LTTGFDFLTVGCFVCLVGAFFVFTKRDLRTLAHVLLSGVAFAVANQLGNSGWTWLALALVLAGAVYAGLVIHGSHSQPR
jgi:hypothetical protein